MIACYNSLMCFPKRQTPIIHTVSHEDGGAGSDYPLVFDSWFLPPHSSAGKLSSSHCLRSVTRSKIFANVARANVRRASVIMTDGGVVKVGLELAS